MRIFIILTIVMNAWAMLTARVELSESYNGAFYRGGKELLGSITMTVDEDDFAQASVEEPIYMQLEFFKGVVLAETIVDQTSLSALTSQPVYLAMVLETRGLESALMAPPDAVSVVRWVKGEHTVWIKVQSSSSNWVEGASGLQPPSEERPVSWSIGISGEVSKNSLANFPETVTNRPYNSRALNPDPEFPATDLLFFLNLSKSELTLLGSNSEVGHNITAYDSSADQGDGFYEPQSALPIVITGNFSIGRGRGPLRFMPHITREGQGFKTHIILANIGEEAISWYLTGMDEAGNFSAGFDGQSAANETQIIDATTLFSGKPVAWISIAARFQLKVALRYQSERPGSGWADVSEPLPGNSQGILWRIYPGNPALTWDGVAVLNVSQVVTPVTIIQRDQNGVEIASKTIELALVPGARTLYLFSQDFQAQPGSWFEVSSQYRIGVTALRGSLNSDFLWENPALKIQ